MALGSEARGHPFPTKLFNYVFEGPGVVYLRCVFVRRGDQVSGSGDGVRLDARRGWEGSGISGPRVEDELVV